MSVSIMARRGIAFTALFVASACSVVQAQEPTPGPERAAIAESSAPAPLPEAAASTAEAPPTGWTHEKLLNLPTKYQGAPGDLIQSFKWGLEERLRYEVLDGIGFDSRKDDDFLLMRTRLWMETNLADVLDLKIEGRDARAFGDDFMAQDNPLYEDDVDLLQAYITAHFTKELGLRVGREMLKFDDERLVGPLLWTNTSRTFDTLHGIYEDDLLAIDAGVARVVTIKPHEFDDAASDDHFTFLHGTLKDTGIEGMQASAFAYYRDLEVRDHTTLGGRVWGEVPCTGWDYDATGAYQFGESGRNADIRAFALHGEAGYTFAEVAWKPRLSLEGNWASGDDDPKGGDVETFDQLFPTNHNKYGIADVMGWRNTRNVGVAAKAKPIEKLEAKLGYYAFWLDQAEDSLYNAGGKAIVSNTSGTDASFVGHEIDAELTYKASDQVECSGGAAHVFAGDYLNDNSEGDGFTFAFVQIVVKLQ